ncbi:DDE-domain-containing protein [Dendrothele bispora CBS 962.96]|uniref:DDE-domain-containing protein n=1 Tax=Dendrothele bispora (strain CBS 962.96) TaxID=1314807 RepID=A0A4V4HCD8_DENBC|nr:DDE-domain-containing protein [Dendrothele bispora CBS 962.96]
MSMGNIGMEYRWMNLCTERNGLRKLRRHGEGGSVNPVAVERERKRIQELIKKYRYHLKDIFNMDETGLFYVMSPDTGLANQAHSGVKGSKVRLTYALTANADGSEKLPPLIIGKAHKPRCFGNKSGFQLGFKYRNNAKAWMTTSIYQDWITQWDRELQKKDRKILLLQDNFAGHVVPSGLKCIRVENFEPNLTSHIHPDDQGIIRCFKAHYRRRYVQRSIDRYDSGITPSNIYDIDQLGAM